MGGSKGIIDIQIAKRSKLLGKAGIIGRFFFGETVGWERILGVVFILTGVYFLIRSGASG